MEESLIPDLDAIGGRCGWGLTATVIVQDLHFSTLTRSRTDHEGSAGNGRE